jgi:hypothetical protein
MMKKIKYILLFLPFTIAAQNNCKVNNQSFQSNEQLTYTIYYNWGVIWLETGEVNFTTTLVDLNDIKVFHFIGSGATYPKYDWFFKVRDKYESYADTSTLKPLRFIREVNEGSNFAHDDYVFNSKKNKIYTAELRNKKPLKLDSMQLQACTNDVLTAIAYARCLDFSLYKPNDTIPITFVLDGKTYPSYMRYVGKEIINTELFGRIRCIKFCPKLIDGTIFKAGEAMTVWATDDKNKIPVYIEASITVGYIKVKLIKHSGLRNKIDCFVPKIK